MKKILIAILLLVIPATSFASLKFVVGGTDKIDFGSPAQLDNLATITICAWIYPTTLTTTNSPRVWNKDSNSGVNNRFHLSGASGNNMRFRINSTGGSSGNVETNTNFLTTNNWYFVCAVQEAVGIANNMHIYHGSRTSLAREATYGVRVDLTVAKEADNTKNMIIGGNTTLSSFPGEIAWVGIWNRALTLREIQQQQGKVSQTSGNVFFSFLGFSGRSTQTDISRYRASGTITGATISRGYPLANPL